MHKLPIAALAFTRCVTTPIAALAFSIHLSRTQTRARKAIGRYPTKTHFAPILASIPIAPTAYTSFHAYCCPPMHSLPITALRHSPLEAPQTLASLHFIMSTRAVYAHARVSACARQLQLDHAVVPAGGRGGESDDEDGAARPAP